jgi:hypothetical protein
MPPRGYDLSLLPPAQRATHEIKLPQPEFTQEKKKQNNATRETKNTIHIHKCLNI